MNDQWRTPRRSWEIEVDQAKVAGHIFLSDNIGSTARYACGRQILSLNEQVRRLQNFFPSLKENDAHPVNQDDRADGILVVPNVWKLGWSYHQGLTKVFQSLSESRDNFLNCREEELGKEYLRVTRRTDTALETLINENGNFLIFPAQFGIRHLGKSARQAHMDLSENEFGLGPFEIACFLLTHSDWLSSPDDLGIDCIGCEYGPYGHAFYKYILFFYFKKYLKFEERWCGCPDVRFGPATGFL